jgi:hypothetical protein
VLPLAREAIANILKIHPALRRRFLRWVLEITTRRKMPPTILIILTLGKNRPCRAYWACNEHYRQHISRDGITDPKNFKVPKQRSFHRNMIGARKAGLIMFRDDYMWLI